MEKKENWKDGLKVNTISEEKENEKNDIYWEKLDEEWDKKMEKEGIPKEKREEISRELLELELYD